MDAIAQLFLTVPSDRVSRPGVWQPTTRESLRALPHPRRTLEQAEPSGQRRAVPDGIALTPPRQVPGHHEQATLPTTIGPGHVVLAEEAGSSDTSP